jgi:hypothetical protein
MPGVARRYSKVKQIFAQEGVTASVVMEVPDVQAWAPTQAIAELTDACRGIHS